MENKIFNFSTRSDKTGVFGLSFFLRNAIFLLWASVITMIFAFKGSFIGMVIFVVLFFALWYSIWAKIWICNIQFNPEKKTLEKFIEGLKESIEDIDLTKVTSCKKEVLQKSNFKDLWQTMKGFAMILAGVVGLAAVGIAFLGFWLLYVIFAVLIIAVVFFFGMKPFDVKEGTKYTLSYKDTGEEKNVSEDSSENPEEENKNLVTYEVFTYSKEDESRFEEFLKSCLSESGKTNLKIQ